MKSMKHSILERSISGSNEPPRQKYFQTYRKASDSPWTCRFLPKKFLLGNSLSQTTAWHFPENPTP